MQENMALSETHPSEIFLGEGGSVAGTQEVVPLGLSPAVPPLF